MKDKREYHYDIDNKSFDFRKLRPTDLPFNKHLFLPQNDLKREVTEEEIQIAYLSHQLEKATLTYISENKGKENLTKDEKEGLRSLQKRNDVIIFQTDKSSRFSADTKENYVAACSKHVEGDKIITEEEYQQLINDVNAHATMWTKILKAGEFTGELGTQRVKENMTSTEKCDPPPCMPYAKTTRNMTIQ